MKPLIFILSKDINSYGFYESDTDAIARALMYM